MDEQTNEWMKWNEMKDEDVLKFLANLLPTPKK
jgi:hypothetical protein